MGSGALAHCNSVLVISVGGVFNVGGTSTSYPYVLFTIRFLHHVTAANYSPFFHHFNLVPSKSIMYFN